MPVIKGPIKMKGSEFKEFLKGKCLKFKPPFEATGWKSSKMPEGADLSGLKLKKDEPKDEPVKEKDEPKLICPPDEPEKDYVDIVVPEEEDIPDVYDKPIDEDKEVKKEEPKLESPQSKPDFDFNNDGKVDSEDISLAAKLMAKSRKYKKSKKNKRKAK